MQKKTKYEIYHVIKDTLLKVWNWKQFEQVLKNQGIDIEYKRKGQTNEIQGISFKKGEHSFKGSEIDRKFSYSKLDMALNESIHLQEQQVQQTTTQQDNPSLVGNVVSGAAEILSGIGGLFSVEPSDYDANEAEYLRQQVLNRKKKPKKRRGFRL